MIAKRTEIVLRLADCGEGPPVEVKVRRLLKIAWRVLGLRCVDLRIQPPSPAEVKP